MKCPGVHTLTVFLEHHRPRPSQQREGPLGQRHLPTKPIAAADGSGTINIIERAKKNGGLRLLCGRFWCAEQYTYKYY